MIRKSIRRFTLLDGMILVGVTALGLWGVRDYFRYEPGFPFPVSSWVPPPQLVPSPVTTVTTVGFSPPTPSDPTPQAVFNYDPSPSAPSAADRLRHWTQRPLLVIVPLLPLLVLWSLCLAGLILAKERAILRRAASRPEVWVGIATALVLVVRSLGFAIYQASARHIGWWHPNAFESLAEPAWVVLLRPYPYAAPTEIGWMIAISWLSLALGRRWRRWPGVMGWVGIALGSIWIAMIPIFYFWIALPTWLQY